MATSLWSRRTRWTIAFVLSVAFHAGLALALWRVPAPIQVAAAAQPKSVDTLRYLIDETDPGEVLAEGEGVLNSGPIKDVLTPPTVPERPNEPGPNRTRQPGTPGSTGTGQGSAGQGGGKGDGSFFRIPVRGQRIVYLIDGSASMGQNDAWSIAARELVASLRGLPAGVRFRVLVYNNSARLLVPKWNDWLAPTPEIVEEIAKALTMTPVEGRTDHLPALRAALALGPDVLYFLTDADDLQADHLRLVQQLNQGRSIIHTIELNAANRNRPEMPLQMLAAANRGMYQAVAVK